MVRIALVSDIHGNLPALQAVLADARACGANRVVNLGDSVSGPLLPAETADFLLQQDWLQLAGNHERQLLNYVPNADGASDEYALRELSATHLRWMASLKPSQRVGEVLFCHGTPTSDHDYLLESVDPDGARTATPDEIRQRLGGIKLQPLKVIACGHTHTPRIVELDGLLLVNPGSVGLPAYDDARPYFHRMETGSPAARYAILEQYDGLWRAELRAVDYDHEAMSDLAAMNGRNDWAVALTTGRMPR
ncbi:metallophosphoesterase family protein [Chitinilyticum piscinae]|uniref:Metallophosphoesterase family protein n=1 Tax=Chitinilyticum piscinae TaxID=2866724 RepID=A0A8J7FY89_9NEIS|nr:metallophosphoesterase family protein [Chitinilyticum piscinae]MBE9608630.1 metallophosphoesterase family protein [Chitinilyticum piscinae]